MDLALDRIIIRDLLLRGIVGIKPDERKNQQDILVTVTMWADTRPAAVSDAIDDAVNYRTVTKAMIRHIETKKPMLADLARICLETDPRVQAVEVTVEKPGALRFARSVGVSIYRRREDMFPNE